MKKKIAYGVTGLILGCIFLFPIYILIMNSFKTTKGIFTDVLGFPAKGTFTLENYKNAFQELDYIRSFMNSLLITVVTAVLVLLISAMAAWVLVRYKTKASKIIFLIFAGSMLIPFQCVMLPLVGFASKIGLLSRGGLIFMYMGFQTSMAIIMFHGFIKNIPEELEEAATIDGCGSIRLFISIVLPLMRTIIVTVAVINVMGTWNDFLLPSLIINKQGLQTLPLKTKLTDYKGIGTFLDEMKEQCFDKYNCMTVAEAPGVDDAAFERYAGKNGYFSMIFDFGWENMEGENDKSSIHAVERWKKKMFTHVAHNSGIGWSAIFLENHDQSRCLNKFLERENISFYSASALASIYFFLYGTPFIYQGQEIGMTNVKWKNINDMDDIRAKRTYEEAVGQGKDPEEVLAYFSELGRDNARTPMQWDDSENGGFTCGKPWIKCNDNYRTINVQSEVNDPDSLYNYYKRLIQCYHDHADIVRQAEFRPMYEEYPGLFAYEREVDGKGLLVIVNFTNEKLMFQKIDQKCVLCNYHETESEWLQPYEARIYSK